MKRLLSIFMVTLILTFMILPASAIDGENTENEDLTDLTAEISPDETESIEPFDLICYDPLINYLNDADDEYVDAPFENEESNSVSPYNITDTTESTDKNMVLDELTASELNDLEDGSDFKNIINFGGTDGNRNVPYLADLIKQRYPNCTAISVYLQGSCSDGVYVYYAFTVSYRINGQTHKENCIVSGVFNENNSFNTTAIRFSSDIVHEGGLTQKDDLKHTNDMTYNSLHDKLIIACAEKGYQNLVYSIDAAYFRGETDALPAAEKHDLSCMISAIAYNEKRNKYVGLVVGTDMHFVYFDSDFNIIGAFNHISNNEDKEEPNNSPNLANQGICCDDNYIYATYRINKEVQVQNIMVVYSWEGKKISEFNLQLERVYYETLRSGYEIEGISILNDRIVLGFNVFWRDQEDENDKTTLFYQYDLTSKSFNIKYCPDDNVQTHINDTSLKSNTVLHGYSTKTLANTYRKNEYKFVGWNLYSVKTNKWRYHNKATDTWEWCEEGKQPAGYEKGVYKENVKVSQTVSAGNQVLFCAVWEKTYKFYVSFEGGKDTNGSMADIEITHGVSTKLPANQFTKKTNGKDVAFMGWNPYSEETGKWYYTSSDGSKKGWYIEGEEPEGYSKTIYKNAGSIKQTTNPGGHITLFALWDEFTIYYDANGQLIKKDSINLPTIVHRNFSTDVNMYTANSVSPYGEISGKSMPSKLTGYYQYHIESNCWRYFNDEDSAIWLESSNLPLYCFIKDTVSKGMSAGQHVVFKANWSY